MFTVLNNVECSDYLYRRGSEFCLVIDYNKKIIYLAPKHYTAIQGQLVFTMNPITVTQWYNMLTDIVQILTFTESFADDAVRYSVQTVVEKYTYKCDVEADCMQKSSTWSFFC